MTKKFPILGIECTAHTFGVGIVRKGKILANVRDMYKPKEGGIIPMESAKHHKDVAEIIYQKALEESKIIEKDIKAIAISNAPGLAPCLLEGLKFAKEKIKYLNGLQVTHPSPEKLINNKKSNIRLTKSGSYDNNYGVGGGKGYNKPVRKQKTIYLIPVNHCISHLEIGRSEGAKDPVLLYASGANTQVIAFSSGKYRVFGETLDSGIGNFIDTFGRHVGIAFPGGPELEKLALKCKKLMRESGGKKVENSYGNMGGKHDKSSYDSDFGELIELPYSIKGMDVSFSGIQTKLKQLYDKGEKLESLAYSMQEHAFAMLVEAAERALAHTCKNELVLGGGVSCNKRLQEMCKIMCKERGAKYFCPENPLLVDNGAMIAFTGEIMLKKLVGLKVPIRPPLMA